MMSTVAPTASPLLQMAALRLGRIDHGGFPLVPHHHERARCRLPQPRNFFAVGFVVRDHPSTATISSRIYLLSGCC